MEVNFDCSFREIEMLCDFFVAPPDRDEVGYFPFARS